MGNHPILRSRQSAGGAGGRQTGQAIIMVTLALLAMCGVLGLAIDFGWAHYVKRAAQGAADTAALAAVEEMRRMIGASGPYPCLPSGGVCRVDGSAFVCTPTVTNDPTENLDNACLYARQNGFQEAGSQRVRVEEGSNSAAPTRPGVTLQYWATVRVTETVPQLFAAITGNPVAVVSARATAGLYQGRVRGSIILTNRENDVAAWGAGNPTGVNLDVQGNANVIAGGGILMASGCNGGCGGNSHAGMLQGNTATITATYTNIRGAGDVSISGGNQDRWSATPQNGFAEGPEFQDPTRKKPQLPVSNAGLPNCEVPGGVIAPAESGGTVNLGPGNYYATTQLPGGQILATGAPIQIRGNINFLSTGSCVNGGVSNPSGFSTYVIYGGLTTQSGQGATNVTFEPGTVVLAGVAPTRNGDANPLFDMSVGGNAFSMTGPGSSSAGNAFVFTDPNYPGLTTPPKISPILGNLKQGTAGFKSGNNQNVTFTLDGLSSQGAGFPSELNAYNEVLMWQDRRNSKVAYNPDGTYNCAAPYLNCNKSSAQENADGVTGGSQALNIAAGANTVLRGVLYQPRGAWATVTASSGMNSPLQLISGAISVHGGGTLTLNPVTEGLPISIVGLVE